MISLLLHRTQRDDICHTTPHDSDWDDIAAFSGDCSARF
jgi:hypothetical protein